MSVTHTYGSTQVRMQADPATRISGIVGCISLKYRTCGGLINIKPGAKHEEWMVI